MCAPKPPDYSGAAAQQGQANLEAARQTGIMGNPNIIGPAGGQTVTFDPNNSQPTIHQNLSPGEQDIFNANQQARLGLGGIANQGVNNVSNTMGQPFNFSGTPRTSLDTSQVAKMPVNAGTTGQQAMMQRLNPQIDRERGQLDTQLRNQGLTPGGEAYNNSMTLQNQRENDLLSQATLQGLNLDMGANQQGFGQALQSGQFGNQGLQQALAQGIQQRELPLNEVTALMSGSQVSNPAFQGYQGAQVQPPNIAGAAQNQGNYNAGVYNSQMQGVGGLFGLGTGLGMAGLFSDRKLKTNIRKIGEYKEGIGMYEYDIFGEHQIGAMADEVEKVFPEAIWTHPSGFKVVNYAYLRA